MTDTRDPVEVVNPLLAADKAFADYCIDRLVPSNDGPGDAKVVVPRTLRREALRAAILAFLKACEGDEAIDKLDTALDHAVPMPMRFEHRERAVRALLSSLADIAGGGK